MSSEHTSRLLGPFLHWLWPSISDETVGILHIVIRKSAHVSEYFIVALLFARLLFAQLPNARSRMVLILSFAAAVVFAMSDEFHQSFVPSRTASPIDVCIDAVGALAGLAVYRVVRLRKSIG
ncbi:MAG: VanZ family protein [Verrucomicrobiota bacterium]|nr:VanZ family protein [Verrucomicrobiota bacterium]